MLRSTGHEESGSRLSSQTATLVAVGVSGSVRGFHLRASGGVLAICAPSVVHVC